MRSLSLMLTLAATTALTACGNELTREYFPDTYNDHYYWAARQALDINEPAPAIGYLTKAADNGHTESMAWAGRVYDRGLGVEQNQAEALVWYERAIDAPDAEQQMLLKRIGDMYSRGEGSAIDTAKADAYWTRALDYYESKGELTSSETVVLASMYARGQGTPVDGQKAISLLETRVGDGDGDGLVARSLGDVYYDALGVRRDPAKALTYYTAAYESGDGARLARLADMHGKGDGTAVNADLAKYYYEEYASLLNGKLASGSISSSELHALARLYYNGQGVEADGAKAEALLTQLVGQDGGLAEREIGDIHYFGYGLPENDPGTAASWYERAVAQGDLARLDLLANIYAMGDGVTRDMDKATAYWVRAIDHLTALGDRRSAGQTRTLAHLYANGQGTTADGPRAIALLQPQVGKGGGLAEQLIGDYYYDGTGLPAADYPKALSWYEKAATEGSTPRLERLGDMFAEGQGTPVNAERATHYWKTAVDALEAKDTARAPWETRMLSRLYQLGKGVPENQDRALALLQEAASNGDAYSARYGGDLAYDMGRMAEARALYAQSVESGDLIRVSRYADMLAEGVGGPVEPDKASAIYQLYVEKLDALGSARDAYGTMDLAQLLLSERYAKTDVPRALSLLESIVPELSAAAIHLGDIYYDGKAVAQDYAMAAKWYERAANLGETARLGRLAEMYRLGQGVPKNTARAQQLDQRASRL